MWLSGKIQHTAIMTCLLLRCSTIIEETYWRKIWDFIAPYIYQGSVFSLLLHTLKMEAIRKYRPMFFIILQVSRQILYYRKCRSLVTTLSCLLFFKHCNIFSPKCILEKLCKRFEISLKMSSLLLSS